MILVNNYSTTHWVESGRDSVFSQIDGQFYELSMHILDCLVGVLDEGVFKGTWDILIDKGYTVPVLLCGS